MVGIATKWMAQVKRPYCQQVMSSTLPNRRLKILEQAVDMGWTIDTANDVVMEEASPLPLVKHNCPSYASQSAEIMVDADWHL